MSAELNEVPQSMHYDCDELSDFNVLPCVDGGPQWWQLGRQLTWSLFVWIIVIIVSPVVSWIWRNYFHRRPGVPPRWAQRHVGSEFRPAKNLNLENYLCIAEFFASMTLVWIWVKQSYAQHDITVPEYRLQFFAVAVCFLHSLFERMKFGFSIRHAMSFSIFLDCLTLPPIITQGNGAWAGGSWLTLAYLRTYHCWTPMKRLLQTNFFDHLLSDFIQECVLAILECILVVFSIAGTLWVMEAMGDIEGFADQFTDSGMGGISFFQMVYFSFITISTVGFGDYYPTTIFSRSFIVFATFGGVIFFSYMTVHVFLIFEIESSGRGKFVPIKRNAGAGRGHILIMGGGITCGSVTILDTFLRALCRSDSQTDTPEIVLLGQTKCSEKVRKMLKSEWAQGFKIHYFIGSPLDPLDLERVKAKEAAMTFIISDFHTVDTKTEDTGNALFASALQRAAPDAQFRLMLVSMPSLVLCSSIGLVEHNCFAIESLKAAMMATSIRCPGFSTLVLNLGLPDLPPIDSAIPGEPVGRWLKEYIKGCRLEPYGFLPADILVGRSFTSAALRSSYLGGILLLGCMIDGQIRINPASSIISPDTVMFALAKNSNACDCVAKNGTASVASWINQFQQNRKSGSFWRKQHAKTVKRHSAEELDTIYTFDKRSIGGGVPEPKHVNKLSIQTGKSMLEAKKDADKDNLKGSSLLAFAHQEKPEENNWRSISNGVKKKAGKEMDTLTPWKKLAKLSTSAGNLGDLKHLAIRGGHTVVILQEDHDELDQQTLWEQLEILVTGLAHAGDERPIVVVHSYLATPSRQRFMASRGRFGFTNVSFCVGDPLSPIVLQAAGCDTCARLLTLAPSAPPTEMAPDGQALVVKADEKMDEANLMLVMVLEQHLHVWGRSEIKAIFDWYAPSSLNLLPYPPPPAPTTIDPLVLDKDVESDFREKIELANLQHGSFSEPTGFTSPKKKSQKRVHPLFLTVKSSGSLDAKEDAEEEERLKKAMEEKLKKMEEDGENKSPRSSIVDEPAMSVDLPKSRPSFKSLSEGDQAYARRDPRGHYRFAAGRVVPKPFIAALYSMAYYTPGVLELMESLINPAKYDQDSMPWIFKVPKRMVGFPYSTIANELLESATLPLGLLRAGGVDSGTPLPYVVTLTPSSHIMLEESDCVYVLANHEWAVKHGLDCGSTSHMARAWGASTVEGLQTSTKRHSSSMKNVVQMTKSHESFAVKDEEDEDVKTAEKKESQSGGKVADSIEVVDSSSTPVIVNEEEDEDDDDSDDSSSSDDDGNLSSQRSLRIKGGKGGDGGGMKKGKSGVGVF